MHESVLQFKYLVADIKRWKIRTFKGFFYTFFELGLWAVILYRFSRFLFLINIPVVRIILRLIGFFVSKFIEIVLHVAIAPSTKIGPGLYIGHTGALIIHPQAHIGKNLNIGTGVIIGERGIGKGGVPSIGDDVYIGVGAKILGHIRIGDKVKIGANAVVVKDIPDNSTAIGVPAKVIQPT